MVKKSKVTDADFFSSFNKSFEKIRNKRRLHEKKVAKLNKLKKKNTIINMGRFISQLGFVGGLLTWFLLPINLGIYLSWLAMVASSFGFYLSLTIGSFELDKEIEVLEDDLLEN